MGHHRISQLLPSTFEKDRAISRSFPHAWPSRSSYLTPCAFRLWGIFESKVYHDKPPSLPTLKYTIRQSVFVIQQEMLLNAVNDIELHLRAVLLNDG
ncbi:hypothetical protein AVEN_34591-1 [Araneus ventricosus]|uniref:Uncharacterized protein n=1 Tax=Araneus ventricosus TaxID=182803 RepID=A0A4Y2AZV7_ARAVE|nr:hypothetical protein AVEN_34591-1 [Araneus ventricosus]